MPRFTYGPVIKRRTLKLLEILLLESQEISLYKSEKFIFKWEEIEGRHNLNIQTDLNTLKYFVDNYHDDIDFNKTKIRESISLLHEFLKILTDHRIQTQGASKLHFTLHLWSKNADDNLKKASDFWDKLRAPSKSLQLLEIPAGDKINKKVIKDDVNFIFPPPFNLKHHRDWIENIYREEILSMLRNTDIFNSYFYAKFIQKVESDPSLLSTLNGITMPLVCNVERELKKKVRLALEIEKAAQVINSNPLHFVLSPAHAGALAIFTYIKSQNIRITFDYQHPHSVEIVEQALHGTFFNKVDGFTLTLSTAGVLLREKAGQYSSAFALPGLTHGLLATSNSENLNMDGNYLLMKELPSTEYFLYEDLLRMGKISKSSITEMEPDEVTQSLNIGDKTIRSIIGFPHYYFNLYFNNCILLNNPRYSTKSVFLFLQNSHLLNTDITEALAIIIRNAWLSLMENPSILRKTTKKLVSDPNYIKTLCRITGINRINNTLDPDSNPSQQADEEYNDGTGLIYKKTNVSNIIQLRHIVLRNNLPISEVSFLEDDHPSTLHYGVFNRQEVNICCATLIESLWNGESAWQLRAMATSESYRNQGIGRSIIEFLLADLKKNNQLKTIWCNSRVNSLGFYKKLGWREASQQFISGNAGLSLKMVRKFPYNNQDNEQHQTSII